MELFSLARGYKMFHRDLLHYTLWKKMMEAQESVASIFGIQDGCSMFLGITLKHTTLCGNIT
jgi:hypothetical protein